MTQLVERSLPIPEVRGLNPVIGKNLFIYWTFVYCQLYWKDENKEKRGWEWPILKKNKSKLNNLSLLWRLKTRPGFCANLDLIGNYFLPINCWNVLGICIELLSGRRWRLISVNVVSYCVCEMLKQSFTSNIQICLTIGQILVYFPRIHPDGHTNCSSTPNSVTNLCYFWKALVTNFFTKVVLKNVAFN